MPSSNRLPKSKWYLPSKPPESPLDTFEWTNSFKDKSFSVTPVSKFRHYLNLALSWATKPFKKPLPVITPQIAGKRSHRFPRSDE